MATEQLSEQLRLVMERQGALENALMQEPQARTEADNGFAVAQGEVGGRADAAWRLRRRERLPLWWVGGHAGEPFGRKKQACVMDSRRDPAAKKKKKKKDRIGFGR